MKYFIKVATLFLTIVFVLTIGIGCHKRAGGYNPYLHDKVKPSGVEAGRQKSAERKASKAYRKQMRKTSRKLYNRNPDPLPKK